MAPTAAPAVWLQLLDTGLEGAQGQDCLLRALHGAVEMLEAGQQRSKGGKDWSSQCAAPGECKCCRTGPDGLRVPDQFARYQPH